MDSSVPVLVLNFHHGALGIARSLGRWGVRVYGVDAHPRAPALASRYCSGAFVWDFRSSPREASVDFLLGVAAKIGTPAILVPTSDDLALFVAENADALAPRFLFPRLAPELVRSLCDKRELHFLARRLGVPTAETAFPRSRQEVCEFIENASFPIMLKGIDGLRLEARTGRKMVIVHSAQELLARYDEMEDPASPNLMLQEYIPGGDDTIWMFNGYFDAESRCVAAFTGRKLRQHPVHTGATSLGIALRNEEVERITIAFMQAVGYRGILDVGYRYDERDGAYKLLDPNPRIGSTFRLFLAENGMDVVRYLYLGLTGQPLPEAVLRQGRKWMVEDQDLESSLDYAAERSLTLAGWLRSLRGIEEGAWFARDDLLPFLQMSGGILSRGGRWARRRLFPAREGLGRIAPVQATEVSH